MNVTSLRNILTATACAVSLLAMPAESQAFFHWCRSCAAPVPPPAPAYIPPPPAVSYYAPCAPPTVVNYVPQTYFRPITVNMPVTSYQPVTSCGMCGPTTTMRPVTTMVQQTQYVPYTSYRLMYSAAYMAPPVVAAPVATMNYAPAPAPVMPMAPAAPACCGQGAQGVTAASPIITTPAPALGPVPGPAPMINGGTTFGAPSNSTFGPSNGGLNNGGPAPAPAPEQPSNGNDAPVYDPNRPAAPQIRLSIPPDDRTPSPASQQNDVDARTAARTATPSVTRAAYNATTTSATTTSATDAWRASAR